MPRSATDLIRRTAQALISMEWLFLALLLPVILAVTPRTLPLLLLLPLLWLLRRVAYGHFLPRTPLNVTLLLLLLTLLVNTLTTVDFTLTLPYMAGALYGIALFFALVAFMAPNRRRFHAALAVYLASGVALAALSLFTTDWQPKFPIISAVVPYLPNIVAAINPNYLAGVLLWFVPLSIALLGGLPGDLRRRAGRPGFLPALGLYILTVAAAAFTLGVLVLTQSRSGLLGFLAALAFIGLVLLRRHRRLLFSLLILGLLVAAYTIVTVPASFWIQLAGVSDGASIDEPTTLGLDSRLEIWQRALYGIEDFPITGMGMGTFDEVVRLLYPLYITGPDTSINHAHNHLLQTAVDLGLPSLIAYLALWFGAAAILVNTWRKSANGWQQAFTLGFSASLLGYFVYGLTEAIPLGGRPGFLFWYLLALMTALHRHVTRSPHRIEQNLS